MDDAWTYFGANKREAVPVLREQLTTEIGRSLPNSLVLLDVGYFLFLQGEEEKALAISALYALDPSAAVVRQNAKELFEFTHGVAARRDPKVLAFVDKAFLRQDLDVFIPEHALRLDSTLLCVFLYGVYGEGAEEHLQPALNDPLTTRKSLEILGWIGSPASVAAAQKAYRVRPDYETFARMTAYMMKAGGSGGRAAMLEVQSDKLDARSRAYYEKIRPAIVATNFEAQSKQFGPATGPRLSDGDVKSRLDAMNVNEGRDETTKPLSILNSTRPRPA